jgi:uncharacterized membrane protein (DUF485 family)
MAREPEAPGGRPAGAPGDGQRAEEVAPSATGGTGGAAHRTDIDWEAAERSPEFQELIKKRRNFVLPATIFFFVWYFGFIILAGYAQDFMATRLIEGFTLGYLIALSQFIMTWGLSWWYIRRADRDFDPLARRAAEKAVEAGRGRGRAGGSEVTAS